jgi:hypothetical protein
LVAYTATEAHPLSNLHVTDLNEKLTKAKVARPMLVVTPTLQEGSEDDHNARGWFTDVRSLLVAHDILYVQQFDVQITELMMALRSGYIVLLESHTPMIAAAVDGVGVVPNAPIGKQWEPTQMTALFACVYATTTAGCVEKPGLLLHCYKCHVRIHEGNPLFLSHTCHRHAFG